MLRRWIFPLAATLVVGVAALMSPGLARGQSPPEPRYFPDPDIGVDTLAARKKAQQETAGQFKAFYQFQFTDRVKESGITFGHRIVDDAARHYKGVHYDHGNGIVVADVDADSLYEIYIVNQVGLNERWKNLGGGKFRNITNSAGVGLPGRISVTASFADTDNDGDPDLFVTTARGGNVLLRNDGRGRFTDITEESGLGLVAHSSGAVFFDFDNDGDLDIVTNEFNSEPRVLISDLAQRKKIRWLKVVLVGTKSNRDGLGATGRVQAGKQTYTKFHDGKSGHLSQCSLPLYFGLADAKKIDRVEVTWPSARKQVVTKGLRTNTTLRITEPK